jgi:hypothetical protein
MELAEYVEYPKRKTCLWYRYWSKIAVIQMFLVEDDRHGSISSPATYESMYNGKHCHAKRLAA